MEARTSTSVDVTSSRDQFTSKKKKKKTSYVWMEEDTDFFFLSFSTADENKQTKSLRFWLSFTAFNGNTCNMQLYFVEK